MRNAFIISIFLSLSACGGASEEVIQDNTATLDSSEVKMIEDLSDSINIGLIELERHTEEVDQRIDSLLNGI
ncbi:MAG: hypothetical protein ACPG21_00680 [Crocinitomicaceae bacterium]